MSIEANPFLGDGYIAATAADVLDGKVKEEGDIQGESSIEALMKRSSISEEGEEAAEVVEEEEDDDFNDPRMSGMIDRLKRIHKSLIASTGGGAREIGKAEFDRLSQVCNTNNK
jgi:hypothetical protein